MLPMHWLLLALLLLWGVAWLGRRLLRGGSPPTSEGEDLSGPDSDYDVEIGDELDLHGVPPSEVDALVDAFVTLAAERRRPEVKIVHGKGTGKLRQRVRARLARHPEVADWTDALSPGSGWGATIVHLHPPSEVAPHPDDD